jgi:hypothetical protein
VGTAVYIQDIIAFFFLLFNFAGGELLDMFCHFYGSCLIPNNTNAHSTMKYKFLIPWPRFDSNSRWWPNMVSFFHILFAWEQQWNWFPKHSGFNKMMDKRELIFVYNHCQKL